MAFSIISFNDAFAEKLIVASSQGEPSQFSVLDKNTGNEIQLFSIDPEGSVNAIAFSSDGKLIGAASGQKSPGEPGLFRISLLTDSGNPFTSISAIESFENFDGCNDISFSPDGYLFCTLKNSATKTVELHKIDLEIGQIIQTVDTGIKSSKGNGLAIDGQGTVFFANQKGLFQIDPNSGITTQVRSGNTIPTGYEECKPQGMAFDSTGFLYTVFKCDFPNTDDGDSFLGKTDPQTFEIVSMSPITRNLALSNLDEKMKTSTLIFSPYDLDFLVESSYGVVINGFDLVSIQEDTILGNPAARISSNGNSEIEVCDDTKISFTVDDDFSFKCDDTIIVVESGNIDSIFETIDGAIITSVLKTGDAIIFDSEKFALSNIGTENIVAVLNNVEYLIPPGKTLLQTSETKDISSKFIGKHKSEEWKTFGSFEIGDERIRKVLGMGTFEILSIDNQSPNYEEPSPKTLKQNALDELSKLNIDDKKRIEKAEKSIEKSLKDNLWQDDFTLTKDGKKVFDYEKKAIKDLSKIKSIDVSNIIELLVDADSILAQIAIDSVPTDSEDDKVNMELDKANKEMEKAEAQLDKGKPDKAINHFKKAWEHSQHAMKHLMEQECQILTGKGTFDLKDGNAISIEFTGPLCSDSKHEHYDRDDDKHFDYNKHKTTLDFVIINGDGEFEGTSGDGTLELLIGKKLFIGKLDGLINILSKPTITDCLECIPQPEPPQLTIVKNTNQDNIFDFTVTETDSGTEVASLSIDTAVSDTSNSIELVPDTSYTVAEGALPTNFTLESTSCTSQTGDSIIIENIDGTVEVVPADDDVIVCTFVNKFAGPPQLTIVKNTNQDDIFDFTVTETDSGTEVASLSIDTAVSDTSNSIELVSDTSYTVAEGALPTNFTLESTSCIISHGDGTQTTIDNNAIFEPVDNDIIVCTFTNSFSLPLPAILTIVKNTNQDDTFDFTVTETDSGTEVASLSIDTAVSDTSAQIELEAGIEYTVNEINLPIGFTLDSKDCMLNSEESIGTEFTPNEGDDIICTFVNSHPQSPQLTIVKSTNNNDVFDFTVSGNDGSLTNLSINTSVSTSSSVVELNQGTLYTVAEGALPPNFTLDSYSCTSDSGTSTFVDNEDGSIEITPANDDIITCTFVNEFTLPAPAQLTIVKNTNQNNSFDFTVSGNDGSLTNLSINTSVSTSSSVVELNQGTLYTVAEGALPPNFTLDSYSCTSDSGTSTFVDNEDGSIEITPANDDIITCTFVNEFTAPGNGFVRIFKETSDFSSGTFDFNINEEGSGTLVHTEILEIEEGSNSSAPIPLIAGNTYVISEVQQAGFTLDSSTCTSTGGSTITDNPDGTVTFELVKDDTVLCTFVNFSS